MLPKYLKCGIKSRSHQGHIPCERSPLHLPGSMGFYLHHLRPLQKIVPWYIDTCHLLQFLQHHSNQLPSHSYYFTMPMQSRILAPPIPSSSEVIPFNPVPNSNILHGILESSFLTMTLKHHHIHAISKIHNFHLLNFNLANGIWRILKDLSHSIHKAADPTLNPFKTLLSQLNHAHLCKIEMSSPCILQIENFSQNMLLCATTVMDPVNYL